MKKIRIYLQKPWKTSDSPYYKYLQEGTLKNIQYVNKTNFNIIHNKHYLLLNNFFKQNLKKIIKKIRPSMVNVHKSPKGSYDLIHCAHCISKNHFPWVADIEFVGQFWAMGHWKDFPSKNKVRKYLHSDYCKKIMPWSEWSKENILKEFPEIRNKVELVYPAIPFQKIKKKHTKEIKLLFVGRDFYVKGGETVIKLMDKLTKKYPFVCGLIVSDTPREILQRYKKNKKIKFYPLMSQKDLFSKIYPEADIFIYPTFSDTFGFAILEAQSFGLPVIGMKTFSTHTIKETIQEGKTGFVINNLNANAHNKLVPEKVFNSLLEKIEILIKDKKLLKEMSINCVKEIKEGKFSIKERNKKLEEIYRGAIED